MGDARRVVCPLTHISAGYVRMFDPPAEAQCAWVRYRGQPWNTGRNRSAAQGRNHVIVADL